MRKLLIAAALATLTGCSYQTSANLRLADGTTIPCGAVEIQTSILNTTTIGACKAPPGVQMGVWPGTSVGKAVLDSATAVTGAAAFAMPFAYTANGGHF